jgi:large subunit ribosomal protein L3
MLKEIFGKKVGMTQVFTADGNMVGVTLVEVEPVCLLEKHDYATKSVARIGVFPVVEKRIGKVSKPVAGYFKKMGVKPYKYIREVPIDKSADLSFLNQVEAKEGEEKKEILSREVGVEMFKEGELVHVRAKTKGRGFAGGMKRHGWHGQPASHGHMTHRRIGSAGSNTYPGRSLRGLRMPGHMGDKPLTIRNLQVVKVDVDKKLLFLKGSVPGARGSFVNIQKA